MNINLARTGLITFGVIGSVLNGSPLAFPVIVLAGLLVARLVAYGAQETERALDLASARRVAELTWELQTAAAAQELHRLRRRAAHAAPAHARPIVHDRAYREPDLLTPGYGVPLLCGVAA